MTETTNNPTSPLRGDPLLDQFALADVLGGDYITSARAMKVLRKLRNGPITEGLLANKCGERVFLHEWTILINKLIEAGYIKSELAGHGVAKRISLTENGAQFLDFKLGPKVVEEPTEVSDGATDAGSTR
jgi:hypothetical protein